MSTKMSNTKAETWSKDAPSVGFYWMRHGPEYTDLVEVDADGWLRGFKVSDRVAEFVKVGWEFLGPLSPSDTAALVALKAAARNALEEIENNERWWNDEGALQSEQNAFNSYTFKVRGASNKECAEILRAALKEEK